MINTLLVCDNNDHILGDFFEMCSDETQRLFDLSDFEFDKTIITGNAAFDVVIPMSTDVINSTPFLFVSYTHGSENELLKNGNNPFVSIDKNIDSLKNSFAYCYACKAGKDLGKELCKNGALCFIGYKEDVVVQKFFGAEDGFIKCAVYGIEALLDGNTTGQVVTKMKEKHTEYIDKFYLKDMLTAVLFMQNRDALVLHGESELTIKDLL